MIGTKYEVLENTTEFKKGDVVYHLTASHNGHYITIVDKEQYYAIREEVPWTKLKRIS